MSTLQYGGRLGGDASAWRSCHTFAMHERWPSMLKISTTRSHWAHITDILCSQQGEISIFLDPLIYSDDICSHRNSGTWC